jgi:hypothetical protein
VPEIPPYIDQSQTGIWTFGTSLRDFDNGIDDAFQSGISLAVRKFLDRLEFSRKPGAIIDQIRDRTLSSIAVGSALHSAQELHDRWLLQLAHACCLKRAPHPFLNVIDALVAAARDSRRLEGDAIGIHRHAPTLLAQIRDEKANCPELYAVAVVDIPARKRAQFVGKAPRHTRSEVQQVMELLAFACSQEGGKRP